MEILTKTVDVVVSGETLVVPPAMASAGDTITWRAPEGERLVLLFPEPEIFKEKTGRVEVAREVSLTLASDLPRGEYPYAVYRSNWRSLEWSRGRLSGHSAFGVGGSHPRIWIS